MTFRRIDRAIDNKKTAIVIRSWEFRLMAAEVEIMGCGGERAVRGEGDGEDEVA